MKKKVEIKKKVVKKADLGKIEEELSILADEHGGYIIKGGYISIEGGYNTIQGGYSTIQGGYNTIQGGYIVIQGGRNKTEKLK